jgi:hypothetical protein
MHSYISQRFNCLVRVFIRGYPSRDIARVSLLLLLYVSKVSPWISTVSLAQTNPATRSVILHTVLSSIVLAQRVTHHAGLYTLCVLVNG